MERVKNLGDMSLAEVESALNEWEDFDGWGELGWGGCEYTDVPDLPGTVVGGIDRVGGEGMGEYTHVVFRIDGHDGTVRHFKMVGCRQSHVGTEWDGPFTEVTQQRKTITVWE